MVTVGGRIRINLAVVSLAFLLNLSAYICLEAMDFLGLRKAMTIGTLAYPLYTVANLYPHPGTLVPAAVIAGCAGPVLWASARVYVSDLAKAYGTEMKLGVEQTTSHFFGIFTAMTMSSLLVGNAISSLVLQSASKSQTTHMMVPCAGTDCANSSSTLTPFTTEQSYEIMTAHNTCGIHNCDIDHDMTVVHTKSQSSSTLGVDKTVMHALFVAFAVTQVIAAMMIYFLIPNDRKKKEKRQHSLEEEKSEHVAMTEHQTNGDISVPEEDNRNPASASERIKTQIIATGKLLWSSHHAKALIPIACHIGTLQVFAYGQFTRHWIACYMGIDFVGYGIAIYGIGAITGSYGCGLLAKFSPRWIIFLVVLGMEISLGTFLLLWEPATKEDFWALLLAFGIHGILFASQKTMVPTVYSLFFPTQRAAAMALELIWESTGVAIAYSVSAQICNTTYIIIMLSMGTVGIVLYLFVERAHTKAKGRPSTDE